jgi:NADPH2:quinone reductase
MPAQAPVMKALVCETYGPPEMLRLREVALPEPGEGQIRIRVHAAGLNFPDCLIIQNKHQYKLPTPFTPGGEVAGVVDAVGPGVEDFRLGQRVSALTGGQNGYAQYALAKAHKTLALPDSMDFDTAAGFTLTYGTSYYALKQRARLQPGESVLVLGAAGGVGLAAVELAKAMGARVIAAASTDEKLALTRAAGAYEGVNYAVQDLKETVKALTGGQGVDVVYDPVGGSFADPAFRTIGWDGRYLVVGFAAGDIPSLPLNLPLVKGAAILGVFWGTWVDREPEAHAQNMRELFALHAEGKLKPFVSRRFPLDDAIGAMRWMMDRQATGKLIINP